MTINIVVKEKEIYSFRIKLINKSLLQYFHPEQPSGQEYIPIRLLHLIRLNHFFLPIHRLLQSH